MRQAFLTQTGRTLIECAARLPLRDSETDYSPLS